MNINSIVPGNYQPPQTIIYVDPPPPSENEYIDLNYHLLK